MDWLQNVSISILGAAVWSALVILARAINNRSGSLSGYWYQVTYYSDDLSMNGIPWSVEIVAVKHHGSVVTGHMWRAHRPYLDRLWTFSGQYFDGRLDSTYRDIRGGGGNGSVHLWKVSGNNLSGRFVESQLSHASHPMNIVYLDAPIEWIRLDSAEDERVLPWLDASDLEELRKFAPRRIVRLAQHQIDNYRARHGEDLPGKLNSILTSLAYAGAFADLSGPLAMEAEKRRRAAEGESANSPGEILVPETLPDLEDRPPA